MKHIIDIGDCGPAMPMLVALAVSGFLVLVFCTVILRMYLHWSDADDSEILYALRSPILEKSPINYDVLKPTSIARRLPSIGQLQERGKAVSTRNAAAAFAVPVAFP